MLKSLVGEQKGPFFRGAYPIFQKNIFKATSSTELIKGCDLFVKYGQLPSIIGKEIDYKLLNKKSCDVLKIGPIGFGCLRWSIVAILGSPHGQLREFDNLCTCIDNLH